MPHPSPAKTTCLSIARRLGLSPTTVSLVLNDRGPHYGISEATIARVKAEAQRLEYRPNAAARQLVGKRSNVVGVLIHTRAAVDPRLMQHMELLAAQRGIRFIVGHAVSTPESVKEYLDDFRSRGVDALIAVFHNHPDFQPTTLRELARFERVIYYERPGAEALRVLGGDVCSVQPDFYHASRISVQHLLDRGRKRIALAIDSMVFPYGKAWRRAYLETLQQADWPVNPRMIWVMDRRIRDRRMEDFTQEAALRAVDDLVIQGGADAIVTCRDIYALRLMAALRERGRRVPEDVAVVGCDNWEVSALVQPALTTVDLRIEALAQATIEMLLKMLDQAEPATDCREAVIQPELVIRDST